MTTSNILAFKNFLAYLGDKFSIIDSYFDHLKEKKVSYIEHLVFSTNIAYMLSTASVKAFIHAIYPDLFTTSSTELNSNLTHELDSVKTD